MTNFERGYLIYGKDIDVSVVSRNKQAETHQLDSEGQLVKYQIYLMITIERES